MPSPILFGKYHLIEKISSGGMAEVYKAKSYGVAGFEKILVIKKILPHLGSDQEFIGMFKDEAQICASLSHGNIVQVIDFGKEGESYFMAMEYVHGFDLSRVLQKGRQIGKDLPLDLSLFILCEILKALDYAHRRRDRQQRELNLVHCDVSPQNALLSFEGEVKLTDFGISRAAFQSASSQGVVRGKYAYMSPEQVEGRPLDRRSDIFSVGTILWELLTGKRLFKTDNVEQTLHRVMEAPIDPPSTINPKVSPELDRITLKALSRDLDARYQEDQEMLEDLSAFMFAQGMQTTSTDLANWLRTIYAEELKVARERDVPLALAEVGEEENRRRRSLFIPVGFSRSVPVYQPDPDLGSVSPLVRSGVAVVCAEWSGAAPPDRTSADHARILRDLISRFERRIEGTGGELWELNYNSLIACFRVSDDPARSVHLAVECAKGLQEEFRAVVSETVKEAALDLGIHVGSVILERRSGNPLHGWQVTKTFALPRLMVNQASGQGLLMISGPARSMVADRLAARALPFARRASPLLEDAFEVTGTFASPSRAHVAPFTRYLGREALLGELMDRVRAAADAHPSVVVLAGPEGIGRSRLREEFRQLARKMGAASFVGSPRYESRHFAYAAFLDALRQICGIHEEEAGEIELEKLARLSQLGLSPDDLDIVYSLFDDRPERYRLRFDSNRQALVFAVFDKVLNGLSVDAPLVLSFEDLQHIDLLTEAYLAHLMARPLPRGMVLVLEVPSAYGRKWLKGSDISVYNLEGLPARFGAEMVRDLLGGKEAPARLVDYVHQLTRGNPLLIKEFIALALEEGALVVGEKGAEMPSNWIAREAPATPQELLARRFAALPSACRKMLKGAAVLGMSFTLSLLQSLFSADPRWKEALSCALAHGVLKERLVGTAKTYRFRHSFYRHLALSWPHEERVEVFAGRLLEAHAQVSCLNRVGQIEQMALLGWNAHASNRASLLEHAGDKLRYEHGFESALAYFQWAYEAVVSEEASGGALERIRQKIARTLLQQSRMESSERLLLEGLASAARAGAQADAAELLLELSQQHRVRGETEHAIELLREALRQAHQGGVPELVPEVERELGCTLQAHGEVEEALHYIRAGYQRARLGENKAVILRHAFAVGAFYHQVGDYSRALESYRKILSAATELHEQNLVIEVLLALGDLLRDVQQDESAALSYKEGLDRARELDDLSFQARIMGRIGDMFLDGGAPQRAYPYLRTALECAQRAGRDDIAVSVRLSQAFLRAVMGHPRVGLREIQAVMANPDIGKMRRLVGRAHLLSGRCHLRMRETRRARDAFERARRVGETLHDAPLTRAAERAAMALPATRQSVRVK